MRSPLDAFDRRNLVTYASLICGLGAVAAASAGNASLTGGAIAVAVVADTFDGRFARLFTSSAPRLALGKELDSLVDAVVFGAAPIVCAMLLCAGASPFVRALLFAGGCLYAACAVTRLAFFNIHQSAEPGGFVGMPAPVAALIWSSALLALPAPAMMAVTLAACAAAMVLPLRIRRPAGAGLALFTCWPLVVAAFHLASAR